MFESNILIRDCRVDYNSAISFMSGVASRSVLLHCELMRILLLQEFSFLNPNSVTHVARRSAPSSNRKSETSSPRL